MRWGVLILGLLLVLTSVACAQPLESYSVDYQVYGDKVYVSEEFSFVSIANLSDFELVLPRDLEEVKFYVDDEGVEEIVSGKDLKIEYVTKQFIEDSERFLTSFKMPFDSKSVRVRVILPEGIVLAKDLENSAFPYPTNVGSDGKRIFLEWVKNDVREGEDFSFFVLYKTGLRISYLGYIISAVIVAVVVFWFVLARKRKKKVKKKKHKFTDHLKEEEEQIISILKRKGGECEQGTLVVVSDFSKAKMSRILKELEERKIIKKISKGKKNIVVLRSRA